MSTAVAFTYAGVAQWQAEAGEFGCRDGSLERAERAAQRSGNPEVIAFSALGRGRVEGYAGHLDEARRASPELSRPTRPSRTTRSRWWSAATSPTCSATTAEPSKRSARTGGRCPSGSAMAIGVRWRTRSSRSRSSPRPHDQRMRPGSSRRPGDPRPGRRAHARVRAGGDRRGHWTRSGRASDRRRCRRRSVKAASSTAMRSSARRSPCLTSSSAELSPVAPPG